MKARRWKVSVICVCFILIFTSMPVSAGEIEGTQTTGTEAETETSESENRSDTGDETVSESSEEENTDEKTQTEEESSGSDPEEADPSTRKDFDLKEEAIEIRIKQPQTYTYTGSAIQPEIEVIYHEEDTKEEIVLEKELYTVEYQNNVNAGDAQILVTGKDEKTEAEDGESTEGATEAVSAMEEYTCVGTKTIEFQIAPAQISTCQLQIAKTVDYTGKATKPSVTLKYNGKTLAAGKDYTISYSNNIKMGKATATITGKGNFTGTKTVNYTIKFGTPTVKAYSNYNRIRITWSKVAGASGYQVYRSSSKNGKYKKAATCKSGVTTFLDKSPKFDKTYYYKVRAYRKVSVKVNGKKKTKTEYGSWSDIVKEKKKLGAISIKTAKCVSRTSAKLTWSKVSGAHGYKIYKSTSKDGKYTYVGKVTGVNNRSYTVKKLKGVEYYFKVKAYRKSKSKTYHSPLSAAKKETYTSSQRLYYLFPNGVPTSKAQMEKYLVTITVPIKDAEGNPSMMQLRVHKKLKQKFINAFLDMYAMGFPVRARDTDTYNWRSMASGRSRSHHSYGCVVDLNWDSNPMIGVTDGKYKPGVDPYSVTPKVVAIWKKYGFYWGGNWKSTKDYMHFSYTNH